MVEPEMMTQEYQEAIVRDYISRIAKHNGVSEEEARSWLVVEEFAKSKGVIL